MILCCNPISCAAPSVVPPMATARQYYKVMQKQTKNNNTTLSVSDSVRCSNISCIEDKEYMSVHAHNVALPSPVFVVASQNENDGP